MPVPASALTTAAGQPGLLTEYRAGENFDPKAPDVASRVEPVVGVASDSIPASLRGKPFNVHWTGFLNAPATGEYESVSRPMRIQA